MEFTIPPGYDGKLLRDFLRTVPAVSGGILAELKRTPDGITLNGEHVTVRRVLRAGDVLRLTLSDTEKTDVEPVDLEVDVIYEDDDLIAVNKPSGMPTHTSHNHHYDTLANALAYRYRDRNFVFRAVNRLDNPTSGIVVVAKNRTAAYLLADQFFRFHPEKVYYAVCRGIPEPSEGVIRKNIRREAESVIIRSVCPDGEGRECVTGYKVLRSGAYCGIPISFTELRPLTGRTHQLRVHMAYAGTPIAGDGLYGDGFDAGLGRLALHAGRLTLKRPSDGSELTLSAPVPDGFTELFKNES